MAMPTTTTLAMPTIMFVPDLMCCKRSFDHAALEGELILSERRKDHPILSDKSGTVINVW